MEPDRVEAVLAEQFTAEKLRPLQIIYFALTAGILMVFCVGTVLGLQSTGEDVGEVAGLLAYIGMGAPVVLYIVSNQVFAQMTRDIDGQGDVFGPVRAALIVKAAIAEGSALIGGVAWLLICSQTNINNIPQIYFGVFLGPLVMLLNTASYFPTPERVRWWLLR